MKKILIITFFLLVGLKSFSQETPKLVVGIVVDQMRYDYIYRFWNDFGDNGFKKMIKMLIIDIMFSQSQLLKKVLFQVCNNSKNL